MKRLAAAVAAVTVVGLGATAVAATIQYRSDPVGTFEVPPNDSSASADLKLKVASKGESARYDLKIDAPIENVRMAHLHLAPAGSNGPIAVWLYPHDASGIQLIPGEFEGRLAKDVITPDDLCYSQAAPLCGDWDGFLEALATGNLYVNVHTDQFPGGEVRDQVHAHP